MYYRQRLCEYAKKYGVSKAARKYQTNRQFVYRQLARYDETAKSLALRSRRPIHSPTAHRKEELALIQRMLKRNGKYGLAEVYVRCQNKGYQRSFGKKYVSKATRSLRDNTRAIRRIRKKQEAIPERKSKSTLNMSHKAVYVSRVMESITIKSQRLMNIVASAFYAL